MKPVDKLTPKKPRVLVVAKVAEKLRELFGNQAAVAREFGVTRQAVNNLVGKHVTLRDICHDAREAMKDNAESSLHRAIINGEAWAVCFYLKTQAKDRGYVERQEHTGKDGEPLPVPIIRLGQAPDRVSVNGHT